MSAKQDETIARLQQQIESRPEGEEEELNVEPEPEPEEKSSMRRYVVLVNQGNDKWEALTIREATSAEGAIRGLEDLLEDGKTYVAVPTRNWNPVPVSIKTMTTVSFA